MNKTELRKLQGEGPYDTSLEESFKMYDELPYVRDLTICGPESIMLYSGNVIKYYCYKIGDVKKVDRDYEQKKACHAEPNRPCHSEPNRPCHSEPNKPCHSEPNKPCHSEPKAKNPIPF